MAPSAGRVATVATVVLILSFIVQASSFPFSRSPAEIQGVIKTAGPRPSLIAYVGVQPGQNLEYFEGLTSIGLKLVVTPWQYAEQARDGGTTPSFQVQREGIQTVSMQTVSIPWDGPRTLALVWTSTHSISSDEQARFAIMADGIRDGTCCFWGYVGTTWGGEVGIVAGGIAVVALAVTSAASVIWWKSQATQSLAKVTDVGGLVQLLDRTQVYVARLRQLAGWLRASLTLLSLLLIALWAAAAQRTLPSNFNFIFLGLAAALGATVFPIVQLSRRHSQLKREEARLSRLETPLV